MYNSTGFKKWNPRGLPAVAAGENARIPMNLHLPASYLGSKAILFIDSHTVSEAIDELKQPLLIFGVLVVVFLDLFVNWWMAGTP